ncbi:MAG TPA: CheR family methyltransferase [Candidatus Eisenbacteria bacterium]|nr:CheR family methyltransferase [Candidatus Eisenbacteria bacterium]
MTEAQGPESGHLVVVGSSAGGIEALGILVSGISVDFPAPIVLAQHLDPNRPSQLSGILERRSTVPVVTVTQNTPLEPGHVYVIPSNRHVVIRDGHVGLEEDHSDRPRPSIDLLLSTAARSYGENLIAVILTGSGSDGAEGAVEVKEAGGCVVIQNPRTAAHPSMPAALPPTAVDHVADIGQIAPLLLDILRGTVIEKRMEAVDHGALDQVLSIVTRHGNIDFRQYKSTTILRRLSRRMAVNHTHTLEEYRDFIDTHPSEAAELTKSLLIKVTEFFRDAEAFTFLENDVVPKVIEAGRERGRVLRLWSAGCATGEEAYSIALLFANALGRELPEWSVKIFATDVDDDAISYARRGFYPTSVLRNLSASYKARFFEPVDHGLRISKALRQMIIFGQQDLARGVPFPRIDLVTCRNLLIYFKPDLQQAVLDLFAYSLHQTQGYLFLGKAETARPSKSVYEMVNKKWKIYRCVSGPLPIPVRAPADPVRREPPPPLPPVGDAVRPDQRFADEADLRRTNELLLRSLPVGTCVIDRNYRIITINASARRLLGVRETAMDHDFLHTVRGLPYSEVRGAIDRTFRERVVTVLSQLEMSEGLGEARFLTLQMIPFEGAGVDSILVCVENVTELVQTNRRLEAVQSEQNQLAEELGAVNHRLGEMNKDLQDANEELQAANEEMMLAQEELQATNEEFEATNEELQATNEELETNNEELQATNEELETTNEELQARTSELQELTHVLTGERGRLSEIVEQAPFHVMVLRGPNLVLENMNPPLGELFQAPVVINRPFEEVCTDPALEPVRIGVRRAFVEGRPWYSDWIRLGSGDRVRYFQFAAVPTHEQDASVDGVVVYVEDVTERRKHDEADKLAKIRLMLDHASQLPMGLFDGTGILVHASEQYLVILQRLRHIEPSAAIGQHWSRLWFGQPEFLGAFDEVVRTGQTQRLQEVRAANADDRTVWDCTLIPITPDQGGPLDHVVLTCVEITRPILAREALEQVDLLKDSFLSLASHELRTPLTPLAAYVEVLAHLIAEKRRGPEWERQMGDIVAKFRRQIEYLSRLTEDLVDISRIRSGRLSLDQKPVDLKQAVEDGRDQAVAIGRGVAVEVEVEDGNLMVDGDEMRLAQVVYNLLSNSMKHAPRSERIQVRVRERKENGQAWGRVEVEDKGPGIPEAYRDDLFLRFLSPTRGRGARSGLGLGLFISARIVEQHGGHIGVEHLSPGTRVWFEVPVMPPPGGPTPKA